MTVLETIPCSISKHSVMNLEFSFADSSKMSIAHVATPSSPAISMEYSPNSRRSLPMMSKFCVFMLDHGKSLYRTSARWKSYGFDFILERCKTRSRNSRLYRSHSYPSEHSGLTSWHLRISGHVIRSFFCFSTHDSIASTPYGLNFFGIHANPLFSFLLVFLPDNIP